MADFSLETQSHNYVYNVCVLLHIHIATKLWDCSTDMLTNNYKQMYATIDISK